MSRIWAQCLKELMQFKRDRLTVALAFLLPFISLIIYGFGTRLEIKHIPLVVQNFDNGLLSLDYIDRLFSNEQFDATRWPGRDVLTQALDTGKAEAGIIIPPEFSRMVKSGRGASVEALIDGTDVNNARVIKNSVIATTNGYLSASGLIKITPLIQPNIRLWFNPGRKESLYVVPGVFGIVLWIYPALLAALAIARENESGTILQAYASSLTADELIAGKGLAYLIVGMGIAITVVLSGSLIFSLAPAGDPTPFLIGIVLYILDSALFGLMIGAGAKTQSAAVQGVAFGGFTVSLLLSGYLYPVRNIPFPLSLLAYVVPPRYFIELSRDAFVRGSGWPGVWYIPPILMLFGLLFFRIAAKRMSGMQIKA